MKNLRILCFLLAAVALSSCNNNYRLCMIFDNVEGLQWGAPVKVNGMEAGKVKNLKAFREGVFVMVDMKEEYKIPERAVIILKENGMFGGKYIDVIMPKGKNYLHDGDTIIGFSKDPIIDLSNDVLHKEQMIDSLMQHLTKIIKQGIHENE